MGIQTNLPSLTCGNAAFNSGVTSKTENKKNATIKSRDTELGLFL